MDYDSPVLTTQQVAKYLKVTQRTVFSMLKENRVPGFKVGGQWRFRREDIDKWIEEKIKSGSRKYMRY